MACMIADLKSQESGKPYYAFQSLVAYEKTWWASSINPEPDKIRGRMHIYYPDHNLRDSFSPEPDAKLEALYSNREDYERKDNV